MGTYVNLALHGKHYFAISQKNTIIKYKRVTILPILPFNLIWIIMFVIKFNSDKHLLVLQCYIPIEKIG